jgi:hypothetical protein
VRSGNGPQAYDVDVPVESPSPPVAELLDWLALAPRTYRDTIDAWKTHCPRLSAWEDALVAGLIAVERNGDGESHVVLTAAGRAAHTSSC